MKQNRERLKSITGGDTDLEPEQEQEQDNKNNVRSILR